MDRTTIECLKCELPEADWENHEASPCCCSQCLDSLSSNLTRDDMIETIRRVMERNGGHSVTSGDMKSSIGDHARGHCSFENDHNLVWVVGCSPAFIDAVIDMLNRNEIVMYPSSMLVMMIDGCAIPTGMPIAKRPPKGGYKHPHFCPVVFYGGDVYDRMVARGTLVEGARRP